MKQCFFLILLLPFTSAAQADPLRAILGSFHYNQAFAEGWNQNCPYTPSCCRAKQAGIYLLDKQESLRPRPGTPPLGELRENYDHIVRRLILEKGYRETDEQSRALIEHTAQAMRSERNPLTFPQGSADYMTTLGNYFRCSPEAVPPPCNLLAGANETALRGFVLAYKPFVASGTETPPLSDEQLQQLQRERTLVKQKIDERVASPLYREYSTMIESDVLPLILRECGVNANEVTVNKFCLADPFGEVRQLSGHLKSVLAFLRRKAPRLTQIQQVEEEKMRKQHEALQVESFLHSRRKGYYVGRHRVGKRPSGGELFAGALKQSLPNISHTLMLGIFRPNYQFLYNQAIYSKNREYLYRLMARPEPQFYQTANTFAPPCLSQFCYNTAPYFNPTTTTESSFNPLVPLRPI